MRLFALVHSPMLAPSCWGAVVGALEGEGNEALALDYGGVAAPRCYDGAGERAAAALAAAGGPVTLVLHSAAGALAGPIVTRLTRPPAAAIFVDAILPRPGLSWMDTAPAKLGRRVRGMAAGGVLPPWSEWFGPEAMDRLLPDPAARTSFESALPRVPIAFLEAREPDWAGASRLHAAYLQLSAVYEQEAVEAARMGWTVRREAFGHLAMMSQPDKLARILIEVADMLEAQGEP